MLPDIKNREDIITLVNAFYDEVRRDELLAPIFNERVKINWDKHLPVMYDFWENIVFYTGSYNGNPMQVHKQMHEKFSLTAADFMRWIQLFTQTVDRLFEGDNAELVKQRATSIATVMQLKILHPSVLHG